MADDPFTQTFDTLWQLLESHEGFSRHVRLGNRIKFSGGPTDPRRGSLQSADLPEVRIVPDGGKMELFATSTSSRAIQDYRVIITTGTLQADKSLLPLKWELMKALAGGGDNLGLTFVRKVRITELRESMERDHSPAINGWSAVLTVSVEMWFANSQLQS